MTSAAHDAQDVDDRLAHDLPLDSHVHTELSHDSDVVSGDGEGAGADSSRTDQGTGIGTPTRNGGGL